MVSGRLIFIHFVILLPHDVLNRGWMQKTLSEILGHSDVKTTLNKYVHSSFELKQTSIDKMPFDYAI